MHTSSCLAKLLFPAISLFPQCDGSVGAPSSFEFPRLCIRYATSMPPPTTTRFYGPAYTNAAKHLTSLSTSTWGSWLPGHSEISATDTADPYGQAAWSSMWLEADLHNYVRDSLGTCMSAYSHLADNDRLIFHNCQPYSGPKQRVSVASVRLFCPGGLL